MFDSGDQLEQIAAKAFPKEFNSDATGGLDTRSDNKGPEPETVIVGELNGRQYAFVALERMGGVVIFDVTDATKPRYVSYEWAQIEGGDASAGTGGDPGPEGLLFIPAAASPTTQPLLLVANEVSGSATIYRIAEVAPTLFAHISGGQATKSLREITLDGGRSIGCGLTYEWKSTGRAAAITPVPGEPSKVRVQFGEGYGDYGVELVVTDSQRATNSARTTITYLGGK